MILIALGSNLPSWAGSPAQTIAAALSELSHRDMVINAISSMYCNPAWPNPTDPSFVNAVASVRTARDPADLMSVLHSVETALGRERVQKNAPRSLDLDLLDYDGCVQFGPPTLPHPRMHERDFVLIPLGEIAPDWRHPILGHTAGELLAALPAGARTISKIA
jgi:2-amino-4-hydroxy-6-hydroxymethyldihydropteridine diphosphokinase